MGPKFYIEDVNEWDSKYSIDYIKFDEFGVIDIVRLTDERDYLVHENIKLPIFNTESEYIDYLQKEVQDSKMHFNFRWKLRYYGNSQL